jgi:class 3 adenylate cyclase/tetratricopeptide (TPR) repeat protein
MGPASHCVQCRAVLPAGAKFCVECGQPTDRVPREGERRQLTVLFCGLVGSAGLTERLDPEDFRDLLASYQRVCRDSVGRCGGHVSQFLGDGVMAYFGYPIAHEDDAVRAVRAALGVAEAIKLVNDGIGRRLGAEIHVRSGLHSGAAVLDEGGHGADHDRLAVGETVHLAKRIQSVAADDAIVVSGATAKLVLGHFDLEPLGGRALKGFSQPVELLRVLRSTGVRTKFEAATRRGLTPHVGRAAQSSELAEVWNEVRGGADRVVLLRGEAGIGKSRIVHHFRHAVLDASARVLECFCSPLTQATAFAPLVEMLGGLVAERAEGNTSPEARLEALRSILGEHSRLAADALPLVAALLSVPGVDDAPILELSPVRRRTRTMEVLRDWAASSAERVPLALLFEDVHWADPSTLEYLDLMVADSPGGRILVCATARPEFAVRWSGPNVRTIELPRLGGDEIEAMVTHVAGGRALPQLIVRRIAQRSEGVPLFVEEVTKAVLESGALRIDGDHYELAKALSEDIIPATVHGSLLARFDHLGESRSLAQLGAAIGREFSYPLIHAVARISHEELRRHLDRLCASELAFAHGRPPNAVYVFKHALIQDAIYGTLLKAARANVHERIFTALRERFPVLIAAQPEMAAHHAERAGRPDAAVPLLRDAGCKALERTAVVEAVEHLRHAIELVDALEEPARTSMEVELQAAIGPAYMATLGWASDEVERATMRLRELATVRGDDMKLFQAMWGLWTVRFLRGQLDAALDVSQQVLGLASASGDPMLRVTGHHAAGYTHLYRGEYALALRHADEGLSLFELDREKQIAARFQLSSSCAIWCFRTQAQQMIGLAHAASESLRNWEKLADEIRHPPSRAHMLCQQCRFFRMLDDVVRVKELAQEALSLCVAEGFAFWVPIADMFLAWASARQGGDAQVAVERIKSTRTTVHKGLTYLCEAEYSGVLAEALLIAGRPGEVFGLAEAALAIARPSAQRDYEPELFRFQGDAAKSMGDIERALAFYRKGIESARAMGAKSLELRSAIRLTREAGGATERAELRRILGGISEGLEQADVREALALVNPSQPEPHASRESRIPL